MNRREFITLLGGATATWPLAARAQQPAMPVIGYLYSLSPQPIAGSLARFRQGLTENGYIEGEKCHRVPFRGDPVERLATLVADLVRRRVEEVIAAAGNAGAALAIKAATTTIPIVFVHQRRPDQARSCRRASSGRAAI